MIIKENILWALSSIVSNKLRSGLSMLGIIIWVFSIIVMLAIWQWTTTQITDRFNSMGATLVTVSPWGSNQSNVRWQWWGVSSSTLIDDDFLDYVKSINWVKNISPVVNANRQFIYGTYNTNSSILWINPIYQNLKNLTVSDGSFISDEDIKESNKVAVIWYQLAQNAFSNENPIWKEIKLQNTIFTVIWVLADNSQANNRVFIPLSTMMSKVNWTHYYSSVDVEVEDTTKVDFMKSFIEQELLSYLKVSSIDDAPFTVSTLSEILSSVQEVTKTMTMFLWGIAAISLIVWWIWVMNIMLVSVTERTREIGIRKALWARKADILYQFLTEALIISILAWLIWIWLSFGVVFLINNFMKAVISTNSIIVAFWSVVFIWIVFGILPASKASNLKPIDALRFE